MSSSSSLDELENLTLNATMASHRRDSESADSDSEIEEEEQESITHSPRRSTINPPGPSRRTSTSSTRQSRILASLDILSSFDEATLPSDFRTDEQVTIANSRTLSACLVQRDLSATILRLAVNVPAFFEVLRATQPAASCAEIFFQKLMQRTRSVLQTWDVYTRYGPRGSGLRQQQQRQMDRTSAARLSASMGPPASLSSSTSTAVSPTVSSVSRILRSHVHLVVNNIRTRSPHGAQAAADYVLYILTEVVIHRNRDAFEGNTWGYRHHRSSHNLRSSLADDDPFEGNLYQALIGPFEPHIQTDDDSDEGDDDERQTGNDDTFFVLPALEALPREVLVDRRTQLVRLREALDRARAPVQYRNRLLNLLASISPPSRSAPGTRRTSVATSRGGRAGTGAGTPAGSVYGAGATAGQGRGYPPPAPARAGVTYRGRGASSGRRASFVETVEGRQFAGRSSTARGTERSGDRGEGREQKRARTSRYSNIGSHRGEDPEDL